MSKNKEQKSATVFHFDLYGKREEKYAFLNENSLSSIQWNELSADAPSFYFVKKDFEGSKEYENGFKIDELMQVNTSGIKTHDDRNLVSFDKFIENNQKYHYRVLDDRYICYDLNKVVRHRHSVMKNVIGHNSNISIICARQESTFDFQHIFVSKLLADINSISLQTKEISYIFPLYLYPDTNGQQTIGASTERRPNLNTEIVKQIAKNLGLKFVPEKESINNTFSPIDILDYIYAVLHSPTYREKYKEFLKIDFPRVPYPKKAKTFWELVKLGGELRQIHLLESPKVEEFITQYPIDGSNLVEKVHFQNSLPVAGCQKDGVVVNGRVFINDTQYFDKVPEIAWNFYIGGYQPAQKWLKDRKDRKLEFDDILHYQKIIVALFETDRLMKEIDKIDIE